MPPIFSEKFLAGAGPGPSMLRLSQQPQARPQATVAELRRSAASSGPPQTSPKLTNKRHTKMHCRGLWRGWSCVALVLTWGSAEPDRLQGRERVPAMSSLRESRADGPSMHCPLDRLGGRVYETLSATWPSAHCGLSLSKRCKFGDCPRHGR